ncbi:class I SAM-dependent methyltransferase [Stieleria sp. JC731]|uniref:class I SAM-dependent methyltransferase n=1 Tax=Pirellulaceae TaxID=2691357 RepID=UPI001E646629|nr:class I SAM-dependent methyltransferase [Stieleria sp. JC731]MCC9599485.1 class I SAM-dependent methyltransferase [Stieleria sp. JC731]
MSKYTIEYFRCGECGFVQTETPYWLDEAYSDAIVSTDIGLISRNERFSTATDRLLRHVLPDVKTCVDYGGGYGMLTRMMRDRGHDFRHHDPFCQNLFAQGFQVEEPSTKFDFLTAFEVFEHFSDPHRELAILDRLASDWLISTEPLPEPTPQPNQWWYYVLDGGQHISLWSKRALKVIAERYDRKLVSYKGLHLLTQSEVRPAWAKFVMRNYRSKMLNLFRRRESFLDQDFHRAVAATKAA